MAAKLFVEIQINKKGDLILKGIGDDVKNLNKHLGTVHKTAELAMTGFKALAAVWATMKIKEFAKEWANLSAEMEAADRLFRHAAINSGKYSDQFYRQNLKFAQQMQNVTGIHRKSIEEGMRLLVTFDEITEDSMQRVTKAMINYAAFTGVSMNSAAKAIGKASMGLLGDLKRVGVQVREETYHAEGFVGILDELEKQMSGFSEEYRKTTAGTFLAWHTAMKDLKIAGGELINIFIVQTGVLDKIIKAIEKMVTKVQEISRIVKELMQLYGMIPTPPGRIYMDVGSPTITGLNTFEVIAKDISSFMDKIFAAGAATFADDKDFEKSLLQTFKTPWVDFLSEGSADWKKFMNSLAQLFSSRFVDKVFEQTMESLVFKRRLFQDVDISLGDILTSVGVGLGAYQAGAQGNTTSSTMMGALAGFQMGGPVGAFIGGSAGMAWGVENQKFPHVELLWEVIDGEIKLISEKWKDSARSQELIDSIQESMQGQLDFVKQINLLINDRFNELGNVTLKSTFGQAWSSGGPNDSIFDFQFFTQNWDRVVTALGRSTVEAAQKQSNLTWYNYMKEQGQDPIKQFIGFPNIMELLEDEFDELVEFVAENMGNAFLASLETGEFETFKESLSQGLYETTVKGITRAFIERQLFSGFHDLFNVNAINEGLEAFGGGEITAEQLIKIINEEFGGLSEVFRQLQPVWEALTNGLKSLEIELGLNTAANYDQIEAIRDYINTIEGTIGALTVSGNAPALNYKVFGAEYNRLFGTAGTAEGLGDFTRYIQSEYLPFMRDYATNYQEVFDRVIADLRSLEEEPKKSLEELLKGTLDSLDGNINKLAEVMNNLMIYGIHISPEGLKDLGITIVENMLPGFGGTSYTATRTTSIPNAGPSDEIVTFINGRVVLVDSSGNITHDLGPVYARNPKIYL